MMILTQNRVAGIRLMVLGVLLAIVMTAGMLLAAQPAHASATFTVNSTGDKNDLDFPGGVFDGSLDGKCFTGSVLVVQGEECTLRAAIQEANKTPGADTIEFDIPGTGVNPIAPTSQLPTITGPVTINGYSQPGASPNTKAVGSDAVMKIMLSGAKTVGTDGLVIGASGSTIKGLVINQWQYVGIRILGSGATGNRITGNFVGPDPDGGGAYLGNGRGVYVPEGSDNVIGGATAAARNVISNNLENGISIDSDANGTRVLGNYIGTDASGTQDFGNAFHGINIEGSSGTVIGGTTAGERNVISGNQYDGVSAGASGVRVTGNFIGTDAWGTQDLGNDDRGVFLDGTNNTVGGTTAGERNVISGNDGNGVAVDGPNAKGNRVRGNYIGTDKNGTAPLGNAYHGVFIVNAPDNVVGGATAGARNVLSANKQSGVLIFGADATANKVAGNYIGTDATGTKRLGNSENGVWVYNAYNNTIGGITAAERNVISANSGSGVYIYGSDATAGNKVVGNYLGTDKYGTAALGNSANGVFISDSINNTVGGTTSGARNVISGNQGSGVSIYGAGTTGNSILSNSIFSNGGLGIDLGDDGPTANDPDDADTGPNNLQNKPLLSSARKNASGTTTVRGTLDSTPNSTFRVEFFSNPSGTDEGKTLLGSGTVSTNGAGDASFSFTTKKQIRLGQNVTATATGPRGNTSEISAPKKVVAG